MNISISASDENLWHKGAPLSTNLNSGNLYDYYEILEEIGRQVLILIFKKMCCVH